MNWRFWTWFRRRAKPGVVVHDGTRRHAVCVGLEKVDQRSPDYAGWNGACPGALRDVRATAAMVSAMEPCQLIDGYATWMHVYRAVREAGAGLNRDDLLVLSFSGHGWREPDTTGTEPDGFTEGLCLYDQKVSDDRILGLICSLPACRLLILSDHCYAAGDAWPRAVPSGRPWRIKTRQLFAKGWGGQVLQFAGSRSNLPAFGGEDGGTWTNAYIKGLGDGDRSYLEWFAYSRRLMPETQPVELSSWQITEGFLARRALT